jgi:hypothetical protein
MFKEARNRDDMKGTVRVGIKLLWGLAFDLTQTKKRKSYQMLSIIVFVKKIIETTNNNANTVLISLSMGMAGIARMPSTVENAENYFWDLSTAYSTNMAFILTASMIPVDTKTMMISTWEAL